MTTFKRSILPEDKATIACDTLQKRLVDLVDLSLQLKQAHWCVVGTNFRAVHLQLDEIILSTRDASDEVAERMSTLGVAPDGRASAVNSASRLDPMSVAFTSAQDTIALVGNRLETTVKGLRESIAVLGDVDPVSQDLLIGVSAGLEKHLWMVQSQEL